MDLSEVDRIGIKRESGQVVLTILDDLEWDVGNEHILVLQDKLNMYLGFIESGEMLEAYPDSNGRSAEILIVFKHGSPTPLALEFLARVRQTLSGAGIALSALIASASGDLASLDF
ncbi:MAG: hypothetical protein KBG28_09515 [Kofleriaceae bacterium]|nr:hypothetical protein [Kofleriaceae bacterium]